MRVFVFLLLCVVHAQGTQFYVVYELHPKDDAQNQFVLNLSTKYELDFWSDVNKIKIPVLVMVLESDKDAFRVDLKKRGVKHHLKIKNVNRFLEKHESSVAQSRTGAMSWDRYYSLDSINSWMNSLQSKFPNIVTVIDIGLTWENRSIRGVKISFGKTNQSAFIESGIHAREWITPATATYIINELLTSKSSKIKKMAKSFDWYIFPSVNPDGFVYSIENNRLWRKNRRPFRDCQGVDMNRNWDMHWGERRTYSDRCSDKHPGPSAFSEPETKSLSNFLKTLKSTLKVYLSFHSFSQLLMFPYGYTEEHLGNYDELSKIAKKTAKALSKRHRTVYKTGNIAETIYQATGTSIDWVKSALNVPLTFTYEFRDKGQYGFLLPEREIIPNCLEVMDSLYAMVKEGKKLKYLTLLK